MRRTFIHIGFPKTGTTYLQRKIFSNLQDIIYLEKPFTQMNFAFNTLQYQCNSLYDSTILKNCFVEIEKEFGENNNFPFVISDELLCGSSHYNFINRGMIAERLQQAVPHAEILMVIRGQADLINSLHSTYVQLGYPGHLNQQFFYKHGPGVSFSNYMNNEELHSIIFSEMYQNGYINPQVPFAPEQFKYSKIYNYYSNLFDKVHVLLYEDFKADKFKYFRKISSILNIQFPTELLSNSNKLEQRVNKKPTRKKLSELRLRNKLSLFYPDIHPRISKTLARFALPFLKEKGQNYRPYVEDQLNKTKVYEDNKLFNDTLKLGMERYPDKYFSPFENKNVA